MANLTNTLDTVNSGKRVVAPAENGPSFLGGLARLGTSGTQAWQSFDKQQNANELNSALDTAALEFTAARREANDALKLNGGGISEGAPAEEEYQAPPEVSRAGQELTRAQRGVDQGRVTLDAMQLRMENTLADLHAKFPDQVYEINEYLRQSGLDHYLFREQQYQDKVRTAGETGKLQARQEMIQFATQNGIALPGMTDDQIFSRGVELKNAQLMAQVAKDQAEAERASKDAAQKDYTFNERVNDRNTLAAVNAQAQAYLGSFVDVVSNLVTPNMSTEQFSRLSQLQSDLSQGIQVYFSHIRQNMLANGATPEMLSALETTIKTNQDAIDKIFFGPQSRFAQTHRGFTEMQNKLNISAMQALPVYNLVSRTLGAGAVNELFAGQMSMLISPNLQKQLEAELKAYDPTHPNRAIGLLYQVQEMVQGNRSLNDIPESQITGDHMKALNAVVAGEAKNILDPEPDDPEEWTRFKNGLGNLSIAAVRLQPGTKDVDALYWASGALMNPRNLAVLESKIKDPLTRQDASELMMATRAGAAQVLEAARTASDSIDGQSVVWKNGRYEVTGNALKSTWMMNPTREGSSGSPTRVTPAVSTRLKKQADTMNAAVEYLVRTAQHDDSLPSGVTPLQLKEHYANGRPLPEKKNAEGKTATEQWEASYNALETKINQMEKDIQDKIPFKAPRTNNLFDALVQQESSGRPGVTGPETPYGRAQGMTQMLPATAESMAKKLGIEWKPELMTGTTKEAADYQLKLGRAYFDEGLEKYNGDERKALMYYHGGPDEKLWGPKTRQYAEQVLERTRG